MDLIILNDGTYQLIEVTKQMLQGLEIVGKIDCSRLWEILRLKLSTYAEYPLNLHMMNDGSGYFYGCMCK